MAGLGAKDILRNVTALEQLIEEINFQRAKEMRQCLMSKDSDTGFVMVHGNSYWTDLFVRHFLFQTDRSTDADDLLFFIRKKHIRGSRYVPKYQTEVEVYRKDSRKLPIGDPDIDWEETVYLNLIIHQFDYTLTLAVCTRTSPKDLQVLRRHSQKVYASPSRRRMDTKGEVEEITYPNVCFHVDNFDEVFCDIQVRDGEMVCVELVAADHCGTRQAVVFLGSIRYDALKRVYDARASLSSKVAQRMMLGLFSGSSNQRIEFVRMKGPQGKGHAEMAVAKPKGSGVDTPTSEPGVSLTELWDSDWEDEPEDQLLYKHQRRLSDPSANFNTFMNSGWRARGGGSGGDGCGGRYRSENEGLDCFADGLYEIESGDVRDASSACSGRCCMNCGRHRGSAAATAHGKTSDAACQDKSQGGSQDANPDDARQGRSTDAASRGSNSHLGVGRATAVAAAATDSGRSGGSFNTLNLVTDDIRTTSADVSSTTDAVAGITVVSTGVSGGGANAGTSAVCANVGTTDVSVTTAGVFTVGRMTTSETRKMLAGGGTTTNTGGNTIGLSVVGPEAEYIESLRCRHCMHYHSVVHRTSVEGAGRKGTTAQRGTGDDAARDKVQSSTGDKDNNGDMVEDNEKIVKEFNEIHLEKGATQSLKCEKTGVRQQEQTGQKSSSLERMNEDSVNYKAELSDERGKRDDNGGKQGSHSNAENVTLIRRESDRETLSRTDGTDESDSAEESEPLIIRISDGVSSDGLVRKHGRQPFRECTAVGDNAEREINKEDYNKDASEDEPDEFEPLLNTSKSVNVTSSNITKNNIVSLDLPDVEIVQPEQRELVNDQNLHPLDLLTTVSDKTVLSDVNNDNSEERRRKMDHRSAQSLHEGGFVEENIHPVLSGCVEREQMSDEMLTAAKSATLPRVKRGDKRPGTAIRIPDTESKSVLLKIDDARGAQTDTISLDKSPTKKVFSGKTVLYQSFTMEGDEAERGLEVRPEDADDLSECVEALHLSPLLRHKKHKQRRKVTIPYRITANGTKVNFFTDIKLDDGAYNPLWSSRGFTQTFHFWKEGRRAQSTPLDAYLTYVTLPWFTIITDILDHQTEPILTF